MKQRSFTMSDKDDRKELIRLQEATNTSVIAFVLSIFMPLVGLVLGIKAHREIRDSKHTLTGRAFAVAAMWIGGVGTALWAGFIALILICSVGNGHHGFGHKHGMFGRGDGQNMTRNFNGFGTSNFGNPANPSGPSGGQGFGGMMGGSNK